MKLKKIKLIYPDDFTPEKFKEIFSKKPELKEVVIKATRKHQNCVFTKYLKDIQSGANKPVIRFLWRLEATGYFTCVINPKKKAKVTLSGFGDWLKEKGIQQSEMAVHLDVHKNIINYYIKGSVRPTLERIQQMAEYAGVQFVFTDFDQPDLWRDK